MFGLLFPFTRIKTRCFDNFQWHTKSFPNKLNHTHARMHTLNSSSVHTRTRAHTFFKNYFTITYSRKSKKKKLIVKILKLIVSRRRRNFFGNIVHVVRKSCEDIFPAVRKSKTYSRQLIITVPKLIVSHQRWFFFLSEIH